MAIESMAELATAPCPNRDSMGNGPRTMANHSIASDTSARCHQLADAYDGIAVCYFVGADEGPIKIGYASNPKARLQNLREASPHDLRILATASGGPFRERAYHIQFERFRIRGEWFRRVPEIEAEIKRLNAPTPFGHIERN